MHGTGVGVSSISEMVYVADSAANAIDVFQPEPPSKPVVKSESVSAVSGNSATLNAEIGPQGLDTTYRFQYGACASRAACASSGYEETVPVPDGSIGGGWQTHAVSVHVQDLKPGTAYHFRVLATNEMGVSEGEGQAFNTQAVGGELQLPDGRQWEMVSPPNKEGALFASIDNLSAEGIIQASASGDAIASLASNPTEAQPQGYSNYVTVLSLRGSSGWASKVIAPAHEEGTSLTIGKGQEYRFFSEDLSYGIVQPFGSFTPLSAEATESTAYLHADYLNGDVNDRCTQECFKPLVTAANVPAGTQFGEEPEGECPHFTCGPKFVGATPDASHVLLESPVALTSIPTPGGGLYEWSDGALQLVSVLPEGETNSQGGGAAAAPRFGQSDGAARNAISPDGSRVIWEGSATGYGEHLYLRDTVRGETIRLDVSQGVPQGSESGEPLYMTANVDAKRIFFLDSERLTAQSSPGGEDLYEYDLDAPEGSRLTDLSVAEDPAEAADVATVLGASADGSYVYFAAAGILAPGAGAGECGGNQPGNHPGSDVTKMCNLYVSHDGSTTFIAALSKYDFPEWLGGNSPGALDSMPNRVSPSGRWLSFMSLRDLAGYDTRDAAAGTPDEEVYLYDASANRLICASCNPTGARPVGQQYGQYGRGMELVGADRVWQDTTRLASLVPPWTRFDGSETRYQSRYLSDSGRMFFDSHDALVPQDVDGTWDVYEYEPLGVGSCTSIQTTFSEASDGCVSLISSGTASEESAFLDASEDGSDVFFLTTASLQPQDYDHARDVYDAHRCSDRAPCFAPAPVAPPECDTGESCKPAQSAQPSLFGATPSETFSGVGNLVPAQHTVRGKRSLTRAQRLARALKACRHVKRRRRRVACVRRARRRLGKRRALHMHHGKKRVRGARSRRAKRSTRGVPARAGR